MLEKWKLEGPELLQRLQKNAYKLKKYEMPSGKIVEVQGFEPFCLNDLLHKRYIPEDEIVVDVKNIPVIPYYWDDNMRSYHPDVYIPSQNRIIEVKSFYIYNLHPEKNNAKWEATAKKGYKMECLFYSAKGEVLERRIYTPDECFIFNDE